MAAHRKWLVKFHYTCVTPVPPTHDGPDACVTLSLPLWTVMVDEVNGFEHRGTTVCATATLHLGRWLDKQNMPIRHLCASSQP